MNARLHRFLALLGAGVLAMQLFYWLPIQATRVGPMDSNIYHHTAQQLAAGQPVYGTLAGFIYPPPALLLLKPFGHVSRTSFQTGFSVLVFIAFWAFAAALAKIVSKLTVANVLVAGVILQLVPGMMKVMVLGNADIFVWALVAWAFAAPRAAGALLMLAAGLKMYPAILAVLWAPRASPRFSLQAIVVSVPIAALTIVGLNLDVLHAWKDFGLPMLHHGGFAAGDVSVSTALVRVLSLSPRAADVFLIVFPLAAVAAVAIWQRRQSIAKLGALVLVTTVWVAPICWWWRLTAALTLAVAVWIREQKEPLCESV